MGMSTNVFRCIIDKNDFVRVSSNCGDRVCFEIIEAGSVMSAVVINRESAVELLDYLTTILDEEGM